MLGDISKTEEVERLLVDVKEVLDTERGGQSLFGLVNNAGIVHPALAILEIPEELVQRVLEVN